MTPRRASAVSDPALVYQGHLVSLRPARSDDAGTLFEWRSDLEAFQLLHLPDGVSTLEEYARHWEETLQRTVALLAVTEPDGTPAGVVQAYDVNPTDGWCFVLSYVTPAYRNQRVGLEATAAFWDYLFTQKGMRKIYMDIVESNLGWLRGVPGLEIGLFQEEGRFRRHATYDGRSLDVVRLALYRERWLAMRDYLLPLFRLDAGPDAGGGAGQPVPPPGPEGPRQRGADGRASARVDLVKRYLRSARQGAFEEILSMVTDDVIFTTPLTGSVSGKRDLGSLLSFRHRMLSRAMEAGAPCQEIAWLPPEEGDGSVSICGLSGPSGKIVLEWAFNEKNAMTNISIDGPPELMTAYLLSNGLPME